MAIQNSEHERRTGKEGCKGVEAPNKQVVTIPFEEDIRHVGSTVTSERLCELSYARRGTLDLRTSVPFRLGGHYVSRKFQVLMPCVFAFYVSRFLELYHSTTMFKRCRDRYSAQR